MNLRILIHEDATLDLQEHCNYLAQNNQNSAYWIGKADLHYRSISPMLPFHPERLKSQDYLDRSGAFRPLIAVLCSVHGLAALT